MAHLPVIMLTANGQVDDKVAGFEARADDYLVKPVNAVELEIRIKSLLAGRDTVSAAGPAPKPPSLPCSVCAAAWAPRSIVVNLAGALAALWVIPYQRTAFVRSINSGRPLITTDPAADASLAITRLAYNRSSAAEMETDEITNPSQSLTMVRQLARAR